MEALNAFISFLFLGFTSYYSQIIRYGAIQYEVRFLGGEAPPLWCPQLMQVHVFPFHVNSLSPWHPPHLSCLKTLFHPQFGQCESYSRMQRSSVRLIVSRKPHLGQTCEVLNKNILFSTSRWSLCRQWILRFILFWQYTFVMLVWFVINY